MRQPALRAEVNHKLSQIKFAVNRFEESSRRLDNPGRGFYRIYGFPITDKKTNYAALVDQLYSWDPDTSLALVEADLLAYRSEEISPAGLDSLDSLLQALSQRDKGLIVRFLYDRERKAPRSEPERIDIILRHMEQVGTVLRRYESSIFTLQGLFIGDWGEMHNTRYGSAADLRLLAERLASVTGARMSVRTPAQWRMITENGTRLARRLGLFNDGILGSETDLGTYDMAAQGLQRRTRAQELNFQEALCRSVPNGGEAVGNSPCGDFNHAAETLERMRVTYLNRDYDGAVLKKWAASKVTGRGCFSGLDGLSYIERRLGYRLFISQAALEWDGLSNWMTVTVSMQNAGFAPLYAEPEVTVTLQTPDSRLTEYHPVEHSLCRLAGGREAGQALNVQTVIPLEGEGRIYFNLKDPASGKHILLANTQDRSPYGYCLGEVRTVS